MERLPDQQASHSRRGNISMGDDEPRHSPAPPAVVNPAEELSCSGVQMENDQMAHSQGDIPMDGIEAHSSSVLPSAAMHSQDLVNDDIVTDSAVILKLSQADFLSANPISATPERIAYDESVEDLIYHRYGYYLGQIPYEGLPEWVKVS